VQTSVLIVDDDDDIRFTLRMLLEDEGYKVEEATDGAEGYRRINGAQTPLVVVLDVLMPKMTGFDVLRQLPPHIPQRFVILTALHRPFSAEEQALLLQRDATLLRKPFDVVTALTVVADAARHLPASSTP
jgi:two-component system, NtrC family, nitrogen regulation response regulator NtrX